MNELLEGLRIDRTAQPRHGTGLASGRGWGSRTRLVVTGLVLVVGLCGLAYAIGTRPVKVKTVTVAAASSGGPGPVLTAGGYVRAARIVYVAPKVSGRVAEVRVKEGDEVAAGEVLATIETRDLAQEANEARANREYAAASLQKLEAGSRPQEIAEAEAHLEAASLAKEKTERELARARALFEQGILSAQALDVAKTEFLVNERTAESARQAAAIVKAGPRSEEIRTASAALRAAEARWRRAANRLADARVTAPIAGRVLRKFRNVGDFVSPDVPFLEGYETIAVGSPVVALADLGPQEVSADINETEIAGVRVGQPVEVSPNAYPQLVLHGRVSQVSPRADRNKNTIEVKATLAETKTILPYDASVKLTVVDGSTRPATSSLTVPASAVVEQAGKQVVFVASEGRVAVREIEVRSRQDGIVTVVSGLSEGERVVVSVPGGLKDGSRVSVK